MTTLQFILTLIAVCLVCGVGSFYASQALFEYMGRRYAQKLRNA